MNKNLIFILIGIILIIISFRFNDSDSNFKAVPAIVGLILIIYAIVQFIKKRKTS